MLGLTSVAASFLSFLTFLLDAGIPFEGVKAGVALPFTFAIGVEAFDSVACGPTDFDFFVCLTVFLAGVKLVDDVG